jgi:hypothetical protein
VRLLVDEIVDISLSPYKSPLLLFCVDECEAMILPSSILADEYILHFSATRGTVLVTSIRSDDGIFTHTVLDVARKDDDDDEEEVDEEIEDEVMGTES